MEGLDHLPSLCASSVLPKLHPLINLPSSGYGLQLPRMQHAGHDRITKHNVTL